MVKKIEKWLCEVCNREYNEEKKALSCEQLPTIPFKYEIGQKVVDKREKVSKTGRKKGSLSGVITERSKHLGYVTSQSELGYAEKRLAHLNQYTINLDNPWGELKQVWFNETELEERYKILPR